MRLCLVEDNAVAGLEPLTLTRPGRDASMTPFLVRVFPRASVGPGYAIVREDVMYFKSRILPESE